MVKTAEAAFSRVDERLGWGVGRLSPDLGRAGVWLSGPVTDEQVSPVVRRGMLHSHLLHAAHLPDAAASFETHQYRVQYPSFAPMAPRLTPTSLKCSLNSPPEPRYTLKRSIACNMEQMFYNYGCALSGSMKGKLLFDGYFRR